MNNFVLLYVSAENDDVGFDRHGEIYFQDLYSALLARDALMDDPEFPVHVQMLALNKAANLEWDLHNGEDCLLKKLGG